MAEISMDCVAYAHLSNKPIQLRKGDQVQIIEKIDLFTKIKLIEGTDKGKVLTLDNMFITEWNRFFVKGVEEMGNCEDCKHWQHMFADYGKCSEIASKLDIELVTGWDGGYVKHIETEVEFGCNLFQEQESIVNGSE